MVMAIGLFSTCKEILKRKRRKKKSIIELITSLTEM